MVQKIEEHQGFALEDTPGVAVVTMTKDGQRGERITVTFNVQAEVSDSA